MLISASVRCVGFVLGALALAGGSAAGAQGQDPFAPGVRWSAAPTAGVPWIPTSVEFAAGGELVFAAGALGSPRWMVFSSAENSSAPGAATPWLSASAAPATLSNMIVRAGDDGDELFGLCQVPDPDTSHRRTEIARFDVLDPSGMSRLWTHDMGWRVNGAAKLAVSADGTRAMAVVHDATSQALRIEWLDGASGSVSRRIDLPAGTLRQIASSADVGVLALVAGLELWVFDSNGATRHFEVLGAATQALALSGDGSTLLIGAPGLLRVLHWNSTSFVERARETAPVNEVPVRCALSSDGLTWGAGWWNSTTGREVRLELRGAPGDSLLWQELQSAPSTAPQNYPEALCISADGGRAAFGLWGSQDPQAEVLLVDRAQGAVIASLDLPGSVLSLALDPSATRLAVGMKHVHANQFGNTGEVRLFDTGERDLQALAPARLGGALSVTARRPQARSVWFLYGPRAVQPTVLAGVSGVLWLGRARMRAVRVSADAMGRADANLPLPPLVPGVPYSVQALFRSSAGSSLSQQVLDPLAL